MRNFDHAGGMANGPNYWDIHIQRVGVTMVPQGWFGMLQAFDKL